MIEILRVSNNKLINSNELKMVEVLPPKKAVDRNKCYIRTNKPNNKSSLIVYLYIGLEINELLKFDASKRVNIYYSPANKIIELQQKNDNGYKINFSKNSNSFIIPFTCSLFFNYPSIRRIEIPFDFTNKPSLILFLENIK